MALINRKRYEQRWLEKTANITSNVVARMSKHNYKILEPFLGSRTVLSENARLNLECYGVELNPSAYCMSEFCEIANIDEITRG